MPFTSAPLNVNEPLVYENRRPSKTFIDWVTSLVLDIDAAPARLNTPYTVTNQTASIGATALPTESLSSGLYSVTFYARITTAAAVSSSLTVTLLWTENGDALSTSFPAITGNTTLTADSGTFLMSIDAASPLSFSTTYASVGVPVMAYSLSLVAQQVAA